MSKTITFEYEKSKFILEFSRRTVKEAEARGLNLEEMGSKPTLMLTELVYSAFQMHHRGISRDLAEKIYVSMEDKAGFISALAQMYNDAIAELTDEGAKGNVSWTMS